MAKLTKRRKAIREKLEAGRVYDFESAVSLLKEFASSRFSETVDAAINLGVDPKKSDQVVRGATNLPNGTGKTVRVAVFAQGDAAELEGHRESIEHQPESAFAKAEIVVPHDLEPAKILGTSIYGANVIGGLKGVGEKTWAVCPEPGTSPPRPPASSRRPPVPIRCDHRRPVVGPEHRLARSLPAPSNVLHYPEAPTYLRPRVHHEWASGCGGCRARTCS